MTGGPPAAPVRPTEPRPAARAADPWRPTRRRLTDTLLAAVAPVVVCALALSGLTLWTVYGNAGTPPRIAVTEGRVFLPTGDTPQTAAFFRVTNSGGSADRLVKVTSADVDGPGSLSRHRMTGTASAVAETVASVAVPAGGTLAMTPTGLDVIVPVNTDWRFGDLVDFTLHFEHSGAVRALAVVDRPGGEAE
ncbi:MULTISPECIES: copper chaperone PCu(A)C [Streptomyces]|uniref:Copper chaperone PCu(A)C n=1 Tax=Streptomyces griseiscabiei TaxID=2993540 RepID=A0ABU4L571_9ACTN|nr:MULTISPECIES: copper chaperone PCu(A)C [Streptomyces]MBZ3905525.1 copper chaperone PCu(A)C [Streptomyces griseiscabiei]MDX2910615.1 copper chaperone PCu(A)C [Streptomyces griseiscabiei]